MELNYLQDGEKKNTYVQSNSYENTFSGWKKKEMFVRRINSLFPALWSEKTYKFITEPRFYF